MKVLVYGIGGKGIKEVELPRIFTTPLKHEVIKKAFLAAMLARRQPYGSDAMAGKKTSAHYHGKRDYRYTMMNREMARMARIHGGGLLSWRARFVPQAVKGRRAHPPKVEKKWEMKINKKERLLAIKSALAACSKKDLVGKKHKFNIGVPIIIDDSIEKIKKTKQVHDLLRKLLPEEMKRIKEKKIRPGKGKMRGRKYRRRTGPLILVSGKCDLVKSARNIPGVDVIDVENLNILLLAPGGVAGRLLILTKGALEKLRDKYEQ